jgi:antitoxin component of MazEF toxin-antitoxin module
VPVEFQVRVQRVGFSFKITLPKDLARSFHVQKGDVLGLTLLDGEIRVRKLKG